MLAQPKGPGIILVFAPIDRIVRVSLRVDTLEVPSQDVVTRDNVTVKVNAVIYFRVMDPRLAVLEVSNFLYATSQLAQTTLRSVLGEVDLDTLLSQREKLNVRLQSILDQHTSAWGVKVTMVEVKQVDLAEQMIRVIARQAEAERERRAKIIHAEGEYTAAEKLAMAAEVIQKQPAALQLRYLQTLVEIGVEKNTTIVFPLPLDIITSLGRALDRVANGRGGRRKLLNHEKQRNRRIRIGGGQPATAERLLHRGAAVRGGVLHGLRGGAELAAFGQDAGETASRRHRDQPPATASPAVAGSGRAPPPDAEPASGRRCPRPPTPPPQPSTQPERETPPPAPGSRRRPPPAAAAPAKLPPASYWQVWRDGQPDAADAMRQTMKDRGSRRFAARRLTT